MTSTITKAMLLFRRECRLEGEDPTCQGHRGQGIKGPNVYLVFRRDPKLDKPTVPHTCDFRLHEPREPNESPKRIQREPKSILRSLEKQDRQLFKKL